MDPQTVERLKRIADGISVSQATPQVDTESLGDPALIALARDRTSETTARIAALDRFVRRNLTERAAVDLVRELLDEDDEQIVVASIALAPPYDAALRSRLAELLDDPRPAIWQAAAEALARRKERTLLAHFLRWTQTDDAQRRRAGLMSVCWILNPPERLYFLGSAWDSNWPRSDDERLLVAELLLGVDDSRAHTWLAEACASNHDEIAAHACRLVERCYEVS